ncbi:Sperm-specific antigen 2 [Mizuhopecten yessoensis]|uniref:Sperm-specific antigen 2 n=2 Tax=Mizuhopecten yessoensis TaxID=6573 RepID=A0A210QRI1_MIZYE|nr:Sperm-specific antigen 2 [Mizuhopecten yessoensis]
MSTTADVSCPNGIEDSYRFELMVNDTSQQNVSNNDASSCRPLQVQHSNVREVCVTIETQESLHTSNPEELQHCDTMPGLIRSQTDAEVDYGGTPSIVVQDDDIPIVNMDQRSGEVMEDNSMNEEDIPMGSEAKSFDQKEHERNFVTVLPPVMDKRLQWLLDAPQNLSFNSDLSQNTTTSMSSDISLDMLLNDRNEDPEDILMGLGFGDSVEIEDNIQRIPERFLNEPSELDGIDISGLIRENPELSSLFQSYIDSQNSSADLSVQGLNSSGTTDRSPHMSNTFCSVMNSMKFLHALQSPSRMTSNYDVENDGVHSILNAENRDFLANQGFYYSKSVTSTSSPKPTTTSAHKLFKSWSMDATERRKAFGKTRRSQHRSLSDLKEEADELTSPKAENRTGTQSFDSFGNFTSVETSTDSFDSVDSGHLGHGRRDLMAPCGVGNNGRRGSGFILPVPLPMAEDRAITNLRKQEMEIITSFPDVDGDYLVTPPLSTQSSLEHTLTAKQLHKLSTKSSTCTLLGDTDTEPISDDLTSFEVTNQDSENTFIDNENLEPTKDSDLSRSQVKFKDYDTVASHTSPVTSEDLVMADLGPSRPKSKNMDMNAIKDVLTVYFTSNALKEKTDEVSTPVTGEEEVEPVFVCDRGQQTDKLTGKRTENRQDNRTAIKVVDGSRQTCDEGTDPRANLEVLGRMESVQSDSSGFAEVDHIDMKEKVSNMGSSAESDQTNQSSATVLHDVPDRPHSPSFWSTNATPRQVFVIPSHKKALRKDASISTDDTFISPDSTLGFEKSPTVLQDQCDSGNETLSDRSVLLTIELPREWIKSGQLSGAGTEKGVISLSYQDNGSQLSPNMDTVGPDMNGSYGSIYSSASVNPLESTPFKRPVRPEWASTPNQPERQHSYLAHQHSITTKHRSRLSKISSSDESLYMPYKREFDSDTDCKRHFDSDRERHCRFADLNHSVNTSLDGSISSGTDESIEYIKLKQLVNKPVTFQQETRGSVPATKYQPKHPIKTWPSIQQRLLLQEETQLVQYALHRYKLELNILETTFLVNKQLAWDELTPDEKTELDELQHLWTEVRKEVTAMEQYLANRMAATQVGNDRFQPLLVLEVVHKMVNLLREQMYQQEIYKSKMELELDPPFQPTQQVPWWPEVSQMLWDIKQKVSEPPAMSNASSLASGSMQDLRQIIREEVQQECRDNQLWLHRELEAKEKELCQLRKEVMSHNIKEGQTKVKKYYESIV